MNPANRRSPASTSHHHRHSGPCTCFIIPRKVLERLSLDPSLSDELRQRLANAASYEQHWRSQRGATGRLATLAQGLLPTGFNTALAGPPAITVYDCAQHNVLPGTPVNNPAAAADQTVAQASSQTAAVVAFYQQIFGRNSVDDAGMTLLSSVHYSVKYNNAFWNGSQMVYGDGDGNIFLDFTKGGDVIGHELTHGVTQNTAGLSYVNQAGGLNESISDVFGSMFRQWRAGQDVTAADWLIGKEILGPGALARGYTCLRDLANPAGQHCLAAQPTKFSDYQDGMDPHESSGIPNLAFYTAAMAIGGNSWEKAGKIWYAALTAYDATPDLQMKEFADRTRAQAGTLFPAEPTIQTAVDTAWTAVGL